VLHLLAGQALPFRDRVLDLVGRRDLDLRATPEIRGPERKEPDAREEEGPIAHGFSSTMAM
jgi:hypothetical protein